MRGEDRHGKAKEKEETRRRSERGGEKTKGKEKVKEMREGLSG